MSTLPESEPDGAEYDWDDRRQELQDRYRFYIMNPQYTEGVEYSLWIQEDDVEYPVLSSNTGGFPTFNSRSQTLGDGLEPTEEFLDLLGWGFHESQCFMPHIYFPDQFRETANMIYDGKPREYEAWAAHILIDWMNTPGTVIPELEPLAEGAGEWTEFSVPVLGDPADKKSDIDA